MNGRSKEVKGMEEGRKLFCLSAEEFDVFYVFLQHSGS